MMLGKESKRYGENITSIMSVSIMGRISSNKFAIIDVMTVMLNTTLASINVTFD